MFALSGASWYALVLAAALMADGAFFVLSCPSVAVESEHERRTRARTVRPALECVRPAEARCTPLLHSPSTTRMKTPMYVALVTFPVRPDAVPEALRILSRDVEEARALPGNIDYRVLQDPTAPTRFSLLHRWRGKEAFEAYTESPLFARLGPALRDLMSGPPESLRMLAEVDQTMNG